MVVEHQAGVNLKPRSAVPGVLGLDIGGANLKAAHSNGTARSQRFALWKEPDRLASTLHEVIAGMPAFERVAVTMTGELCDCFEGKKQGVRRILEAVATAVREEPITVWTNRGFIPFSSIEEALPETASANWLALAAFACRFVPQGNGLLMDIGSTTTDIIPLAAGCPAPKGLTDPERLRSLELVYTGVRRTPLCAVLGSGVAAEFFASMLDVNLVLGTIADDESDTGTADGRPAVVAAAHARLARMLCADPETCSRKETTDLARRALFRQVYQLTMAFDHVLKTLPAPAEAVILSGEGEFLARLVLGQQNSFRGGRVISLAEKLGVDISKAACAYAVAMLAEESAGLATRARSPEARG
jgi:(4-(4-[2-(gamma-L-glutamylamino)ethyl]phenoxymethyl)furan-2-yl)methanamine synthase